MALFCHSGIKKWKDVLPFTFALAGNPNVGKSSIFNALTGMGVTTANYPGKTVEVNLATTRFKDQEIGIMDLPGTYALGAISEDQWVARQALLDGNPDVVLVIVDATRLERNLYLPLQLLDIGIPVVIALNLVDEAWRNGLRIDHNRLAALLGVPVVPTVAIRGEGIDHLIEMGLKIAKDLRPPKNSRHGIDVHSIGVYGMDVEEAIQSVANLLREKEVDFPLLSAKNKLSLRAIAIMLLEEDKEIQDWIKNFPDGDEEILTKVKEAAFKISERHGEPAPIRIARERHGLAGEISDQVQKKVQAPSKFYDRFWRLTTLPITGYPILALTLAFLFAFLFYVGNFLSVFLSSLWETHVSPFIKLALQIPFGEGVIYKCFLWGLDSGIIAILSVGIPYILTFYFILSILEDTGYLNSIAFLTDPFMHKLGLHGQAAIPLVAGAGCNVPAIIGTRVLTSMRERVMAGILICLMPCSARTAVIAGAVSKYVGWGAAISIYLIMAGISFFAGWLLNKTLPGRSSGLVMEMFPFRTPSIKKMLSRTWFRFKDFVFFATPVVLIGNFILGIIYETGFMWFFSAPFAPIVEGWLGLPAVAGLTLLFAVLRKELALQLLIAIAIAKYGSGVSDILQFMDKSQIFTYTLVNTIYIPCVATVAVLARELGWKRAIAISAFTVVLAILVGGIARRLIVF